MSSPFAEWVDSQADPSWPLLPLTHIAAGNDAQRIIRSGEVTPANCKVFSKPLSYFFYGRSAYRPRSLDSVKLEADSPFCFVFDEILIGRADVIHPFDTGAFDRRLYNHVLSEGMRLEDFSLGRVINRPNKLIAGLFGSIPSYLDGDRKKIALAKEAVPPWELQARAYIELLASAGRNEPDDRICSIEIAVEESIPLRGNLRAVVAPHTVWNDSGKAPWLDELVDLCGVNVHTYQFIAGYHPERYHTLLEAAVRDIYRSQGLAA